MNLIESIEISKEQLNELLQGKTIAFRKYVLYAHADHSTSYTIPFDKGDDILLGFYAKDTVTFDMSIDAYTQQNTLEKDTFSYTLFDTYALPLISTMYTPIYISSFDSLKNLYIVYVKLIDTLDAFELIKKKYYCTSVDNETYVTFANGVCAVYKHECAFPIDAYTKMNVLRKHYSFRV